MKEKIYTDEESFAIMDWMNDVYTQENDRLEKESYEIGKTIDEKYWTKYLKRIRVIMENLQLNRGLEWIVKSPCWDKQRCSYWFKREWCDQTTNGWYTWDEFAWSMYFPIDWNKEFIEVSYTV